MINKSKSERLIDDLHQAVQRGDVLPELLDLVRRGVRIGGSVNDSVVIDGNDNIVVITKIESTPIKTEGMDEKALLAESVSEYRQEQTDQLAKVSTRPYPGLLPYRLQDARHFFGRQQSIAELLKKIQTSRVTWLHGRSGTGKSSIIEAGLMPTLLDNGGCPVLVRPFGELPTQALKKKLLKGRLTKGSGLADETLQQFLAGVVKCLQGQQIYIFFDQFEEFFIKMQDESKRESFAQELADCVADSSLPVHFIFSLLTDKFGETLLLRERLPLGIGVEAFLRPLNHQEAVEVITGPFTQLMVSFEDGLVETILQHLESTEIASPQLQLVCEKLFQSLPEDGRQITFEHYQKLGETKGIIKDYLKQALRDEQITPADQQKAATYLLSTLVTPEGERDAKKPSEWCMDERFRSWTLAWHRKQKNLPLADGAPGLQAVRHIAVVNYIRKIEPYVTIKGDDLRQIIQDMDGLILDDYLLQLQKEFINSVADSLRNARLIHEIQTEDGELAYELVHDYLIAEVKDWLDEDEKESRKLRRKLDQQHLDFAQHKSLLDSKELEIVASQLGNPRFALQETDKRLILLSAAAQGTGQKWLALSGSNGLDWLRKACQTGEYAENVRLGAAACLGEANDSQTFEHLCTGIENEKTRSQKSLLMEMLAQYQHHASQPHHLPPRLAWPVLRRQARLRVKEGSGIRSRMRKAASYTAPICVIIMMTSVMVQAIMYPVDETPLLVYALIAIFVSILGYFAAYLFAEITTSLMLIMRRWAWGWQVLILGSVGSLLGTIFIYILSGQGEVWFAGGIISLALVLNNLRPSLKEYWYSVMMALTSGILISLLSQLVIEEDTALETFGAALSIGVFAGVYAYFASRPE